MISNKEKLWNNPIWSVFVYLQLLYGPIHYFQVAVGSIFCHRKSGFDLAASLNGP